MFTKAKKPEKNGQKTTKITALCAVLYHREIVWERGLEIGRKKVRIRDGASAEESGDCEGKQTNTTPCGGRKRTKGET